MNPDQQAATIELLELHKAIQRLRAKVSKLRGLHMGCLTDEQQFMVKQCAMFVYADTNPIEPRAANMLMRDGLYWEFEKFLERKIKP